MIQQPKEYLKKMNKNVNVEYITYLMVFLLIRTILMSDLLDRLVIFIYFFLNLRAINLIMYLIQLLLQENIEYRQINRFPQYFCHQYKLIPKSNQLFHFYIKNIRFDLLQTDSHNIIQIIRMKSRFKILILTSVIIFIIFTVAIILAFCFKKVQLNQYALPYNNLFTTMSASLPYTYGRFFIGIQYSIITFPRGFLQYQFDFITNTLDKTEIKIQATFMGKLIQNKIISLYATYGLDYSAVLKLSIQQLIRQSVEQFTILQIITQRQIFSNYVQSYVLSGVQNKYDFIYGVMLSLGEVGTNIQMDGVMNEDVSLYEQYIDILSKSINIQKELIFYNGGGKILISEMQRHHGQVFLNSISMFNNGSFSGLWSSISNQTQRSYLLSYLISSPLSRGIEQIQMRL